MILSRVDPKTKQYADIAWFVAFRIELESAMNSRIRTGKFLFCKKQLVLLMAAVLLLSLKEDGATNTKTTVAAGTNPYAVAVNPVTNKIYVPNYGSSNVTVIDGATNTKTTVTAGTSPYAVAVNLVTNKIYIPNYTSNNVTVIDGATNTKTTVTVGTNPYAVAVNPVTNKIYVANRGSNNITVIDGATSTTVAVAVGTYPQALAVNTVTNKIYVANSGSDNVTVIDGATNTTTTLTAGGNPWAVAVNPVTNKIYVTNRGVGNFVTVIDGVTNSTTSVSAGSTCAVAVNPVTNKIYVVDESLNNVKVIDGATNTTTTVTVGTFPKAVVVNPVTNKIYVVNETSNNVTVLDGATNATTTVTAGTNPYTVVMNPVTDKIYVANYGSDNVTVFDGVTNSTTTVAVGDIPWAVAANPVANKIYVINQNSNDLTVIDGATNTTTTVAVGTTPNAISVNPVSNKIYVANGGSNNVTVIDGVTNTTTTVATGTSPRAVAVNPATNKIYVANYASSNVTIIDGTTNSTTTVAAGGIPYAVAVNPVTNKIYVANMSSNNVTLIDGATNTTTTVAAGTSPYAVAVNPATNKIYIANNGSNNVTVIDGATNTTVAVTAGTKPYAVAINPVTNKIYVANYNSGNVTIIDGATNTTATVAAGTYPSAIAVNPVTDKIYVANRNSGNVTVIATNTISNTGVWATMDTLINHSSTQTTPTITGNGVNRWMPKPTTQIAAILNGLNSGQKAWNWATINSGTGSDSVRWSYNWGSDSLTIGENFVLSVTLESNAAHTSNLGLGTPFAGNLTVYPVYRIPPPGVPTLLSPSNTSTNIALSLTLNWEAASYAASYRIQVSTTAGFSSTVVDDSTLIAISKAIGPLNSNTNYYWRANAKNPTGTSAWSTVWSFITDKATPAITTWPIASAITYGQALSASSLNGQVNVTPGTFAFTTPTTVPNAGTANQSVTFTPSDVSNYNTATQTVSVTVNKAAPTITTWPTAAAITYGQALSSSTLSGQAVVTAGTFAFTTPSTTPAAGTANQSVTFTPSDATNYNTATQTVSVTVNKATPVITTWPAASAITYGQALSSSTLSGQAAVTPGTFAFTTPSTTPAAGTANQSVTFTPSDATNYNTATQTVSVTVNKATPTITTWPTAAAITYGQTLSSSNLSGQVVVTPGTFAFTTPSTMPSVGASSNSVTFTPTDAANYTTLTQGVSVLTNQKSLMVTAENKSKVFGATDPALSVVYSGFIAGENASVLSGTLSILRVAGEDVGTYTITPSGLSSSNYTITFTNGTFSITGGVAQTITFGSLPDKTYGDIDFAPGATASSGLSVSYTSSNTAVATIISGQIHIVGAGASLITASQSGNASYAAAADVQRTLNVNKATPTITTWPTASSITYGQVLSSSNLSGQAVVTPGTFVFTTPSTTPATGTANQSVTFTPSDASNYNTATQTVSVTVNKATPTITTWPTASAITYGQALSSSSLSGQAVVTPGAFAYTAPSITPTAGTANQSVTFTPYDASNYNTATQGVSVTVNKATPTITTWPTASAITYGQTLSSSILSGQVVVTPGTFAFTTPSTMPSVGTSSNSVTFTPTDATNYTTVTQGVSVLTNQKSLTITAENKNKVFGATDPALTVVFSGFIAGENASVLSGTLSILRVTGEDVGTYTITPSGLTSSNYTIIFTNGTFSITGGVAQTITFGSLPDKTYGDIDYALGATASSGLPVSCNSSNTAVATIISGQIHIVGAGTSVITASQSGNASYAAAGDVQHTLTVNKATPTITTWPTASAITYGQALSASSLSGQVVVTPGTFAFNTPSATPAVGTANQSVTFTPSDASNYNTATQTVSVTVNKASPTITTWPTASAITYGQSLSSSSLTGQAIVTPGSFAFTTPSTTPTAGTANQTVTFTPTDVSNYSLAVQNVSVTVDKKALTITAEDKNKVFGAADPTLTAIFNGFVAGENVSVLTGTLALVRLAGEDVGTYTISPTGLTSSNYSIIFVNGTFSIAGGAAQTISFGSLPGKTYGDIDFVPGATASSGLPVSYNSSNTAAATIINGQIHIVGAGSSTITASQAGNINYAAAASVQQTLTVSQKSLVLISVTAANKIYDGTTFATLSGGTLSGVVGSDVVPITAGTGTFADKNVGTGKQVTVSGYSISGANAANYALAAQPSGIVAEITKKEIAIAAENKSKVYGATDPALSAAFSGFVSDENATALSGTLSIARLVGEDAGTYAITVSGLSSTNYAISYSTGLFTINGGIAQTITFGALAAKTNGDAAFTLGAIASSGLTVTYTITDTTVAKVSGTTVTIAGAGVTAIIASQLGNVNYLAAPTVSLPLLVIPAAPALISPSGGATVSITPQLMWEKSNGALAYHTQVSKSALFETLQIDTSGIVNTSYPIAGLLNDTKYYWRTRAIGSAGTSGWSPIDSFKTILALPRRIMKSAIIVPDTIHTDSTVAKWLAAVTPKADRYWIKVSTDTSGLNVVFQDSSLVDTSIILRRLQNGVYMIRLCAYNAAGWGENGELKRLVVALPTSVLSKAFSPKTFAFGIRAGKLSYDLPVATNVTLKIFNLKGVCVNNAIDRIQPAGRYTLVDVSSLLSAGQYIYCFKAGKFERRVNFVTLH
jgi:YVTN family beta-propeller protein